MSFLDKAKETAQQAAEKAKEAAEKAAHKIEDGGYIDKAAAKIDQKTGGKHSETISKVASGAKGSVGKLTGDDDAEAEQTEEKTVDMEYSTEFGTEPTETAAEAAGVFEDGEQQA
jgi:hypothetical protein